MHVNVEIETVSSKKALRNVQFNRRITRSSEVTNEQDNNIAKHEAELTRLKLEQEVLKQKITNLEHEHELDALRKKNAAGNGTVSES